MRIDGLDIPGGTAGLPLEARKPQTPEAAAEQFEQILVKQMVHTMTKELFDGSLTGDDAPQWMGAYGDMQSDILAEELAKQLSKSGRMGISELLMKQWRREGELPEPDADPSAAPVSNPNDFREIGPVNPFTEV